MNHELSHYVRLPLRARKFHSHRWKGNLARFHLIEAAEEGTAEFVGMFLCKGVSGTAAILEQLSEIRNTHDISAFYKAIASEAANPKRNMKKVDAYLKRHRSGSIFSISLSRRGLSIRGPSLKAERYNIGVMLSVALLAANGFDERATALEMLTHSNESLINHVIEAAANDDGRLADSIMSISLVNEGYLNIIQIARNRAAARRQGGFEALVSAKRGEQGTGGQNTAENA